MACIETKVPEDFFSSRWKKQMEEEEEQEEKENTQKQLNKK